MSSEERSGSVGSALDGGGGGLVNPSAQLGASDMQLVGDRSAAHDSGHVSPTTHRSSAPVQPNPALVASTPYHHHNFALHHQNQLQQQSNAVGHHQTTTTSTTPHFTPVHRPPPPPAAGSTTNDYEDDLSGCFSHLDATSPDSEYDEALAFPDSVTVVTMGDDRPVLVERPPRSRAATFGGGGANGNATGGDCGGCGGGGGGTDTDSAHEHWRAAAAPIEIPFQTLYKPAQKVKSVQRKVFIPGAEIGVEIIDHERSITSHLLNPNLYHIRLTHGPFSWTIKKRYKHISALHHQLLVFRTSLNFPFPTRKHKERRESFRNTYDRRSKSGSVGESPVRSNGVGVEARDLTIGAAGAEASTVAMPIDSVDDSGRIFAENTIEMSAKSPAIFPDKTADILHNSTTSPGLKSSSLPTQAPAKKKPRRKGALPRFPNRPESLVPVEALPERIRALESYLQAMLNIRLYRNHHETVAFLEVSQLSFVAGLGEVGKEAMIMKRTGFTRPGQSGCNCMGCFHGACCVQCNVFCSGRWRQRWLFVRETCFGYLNPKDGSVRCVALFDQGFDVSTGVYSTGMRNGLQLMTAGREMVLKSWTRRKAKEWVGFLKEVAQGTARDFTCANPHGSFAPVRASALAAWFVDGAAYMSAVADAMEAAREEIYIADWWLSPEIHMKRPAVDGDYWRLDQILKRKAEQGVHIFVMVYKEVEVALGINSYYSKQRLVDLHPNIRVFRSPDHARKGVLFWAHHEKIVAVDQTYAFVGGIDLCYGRWDDYQHRLTDLGPQSTGSVKRVAAAAAAVAASTHQRWRLPDVTPKSPALSQQPHRVRIEESDVPKKRSTLPQLLPGDRLIIGDGGGGAAALPAAEEVQENTKRNTPEMERKNVLGKLKDNMRERGKQLMERITTADATNGCDPHPHNNGPMSPQATADSVDPAPFQTAILNNWDGKAKYWIGKDYVNFIIKDLTNLDAPFTDIVDRAVQPRLPWHDVGAMVAGASARDVARHFIQRWNATKLEKARDNATYPYLFPKSYAQIPALDLPAYLPDASAHRVTCQVLRSASSWSAGFIEQDTVEQSIHDAYIQTITKAQHYLYIENQFFISLDAMATSQVKNQIANALVRRIVRAHRERQVFRVYVVMPLLPAFEGDVGGTTGIALRAITHWNYASICRGKQSVVERLRAAGVERPSDYISFHSVRTSDVLLGQPVTELIYVHSKLMIADDRVVICGSANINDRSMIGKRDSEIAVMLTDEVFERGCMNGQPYPSGAYAGQLRRFLFREHLGMIDDVSARPTVRVSDPVIEAFWSGIWRRTSERNTRVFDRVFKCVPTNAVATFGELKRWQEEPSMARTNPEAAINEMKTIQGNLVDMPFDFLWRESLTPHGTSKEGLLPTSVWT